MSDAYWAKPACTRRLVTCSVIAAIHAFLFVSCRPSNQGFRANSSEGNRTLFLVPPRAIPLAIESEGTRKPASSVQKNRPTANKPPSERRPASDETAAPNETADPDDIAAVDKVPAIAKEADVDPEWATVKSVQPAPVSDIRTYSLSMAGKADAEARQGKPAPLEPVDTPFSRFRNNLAQAGRGGGNGTTVGTSSSGEPITMVMRNGKMRCYVKVSTSVAPSAVFDNRGSGRASEIQCPRELMKR